LQFAFLRGWAVIVARCSRVDGNGVMLGLSVRIPGQQAGGVSSNVFENWFLLWDGFYNSEKGDC